MHSLQTHIGNQNYAETWSVQLFRSIDSSSAADLPRTQAALKMGLSTQKGKVVDFSIQVIPPPPPSPAPPSHPVHISAPLTPPLPAAPPPALHCVTNQ